MVAVAAICSEMLSDSLTVRFATSPVDLGGSRDPDPISIQQTPSGRGCVVETSIPLPNRPLHCVA